jgi:hypothetical protein
VNVLFIATHSTVPLGGKPPGYLPTVWPCAIRHAGKKELGHLLAPPLLTLALSLHVIVYGPQDVVGSHPGVPGSGGNVHQLSAYR